MKVQRLLGLVLSLVFVLIAILATHSNVLSQVETLWTIKVKNPGSYTENKKISELLDKEGFKFGITCNEAVELYGFNNIFWDGRGGKSLNYKNIKHKGDTYFDSGHCNEENYLDQLRKHMAHSNYGFNQIEFSKRFTEKYGKGDSAEGYSMDSFQGSTGYLIKHKGRYICFNAYAGSSGNTKIFYEARDMTFQFMNAIRGEEIRKKELDRVIK